LRDLREECIWISRTRLKVFAAADEARGRVVFVLVERLPVMVIHSVVAGGTGWVGDHLERSTADSSQGKDEHRCRVRRNLVAPFNLSESDHQRHVLGWQQCWYFRSVIWHHQFVDSH
jgi:hypothetical protein